MSVPEFTASCNDKALGMFDCKKDAYKAIVTFLMSMIPKSRGDILGQVKQDAPYLSSGQLAHWLCDLLWSEGLGKYKFVVE